MSVALNIADLSGASAFLALGLTVWQVIIVSVLGNAIICAALVTNGQGGGKWHIPFAVLNRTAWGIRGTWFPVLNRIVLSCCWYGVEGWYGGQVVKVMIGAIWPSFYTLKNHFPSSVAMQTNEFVAFFIFWLISFPYLLIRPERYALPAVLSSVSSAIAIIAILIWILVKQGDAGPLVSHPQAFYSVSAPTGSELAWTMVRCITSSVGAWSGAILYQSDFSRFAVKPGDQIWGQIFIIPFCLIGTTAIGIVITSCARGLYPDEPLLWKTFDLLEAIQKHEGTSGARAAVFFCALAFFLSQLCVNVAAVAIVGGIDLSTLLPRYINVRRGAFIIAAIGMCINPWQFLNTANNFISVIGGYAVFLGPLSGIMIVDYHVLRKRRISLSHLFLPGPASDYWYWRGLNLRAPVAWVLGVFPSMPGFCAAVSSGKVEVSVGWMRVYYLSWMLGFAISGTIWMLLNSIWPPPNVGMVDEKDVFGTFGVDDLDLERKIEESRSDLENESKVGLSTVD